MNDGKPTVKIPAARPASAPRLPVPRPASRPDIVEEVTAKHRDASTDATRQQSETQHDFKATVGGMIAHTERLESAVQNLGGNDAIQNVALVILARELGVEHKLPPALQQSLPPPAGASLKPPPPPVLGRIEARSKSAQYAQVLVALGVIADLLGRILFPHN